MPLFLSIQSTYEHVEIALKRGSQLLGLTAIHKFNASAELILVINNLLSAHSVPLTEIAFIAINRGPSPFTTLRVAIATVNGISFATNIPLVGVNGLSAFVDEFHTSETPVTIALLNAFNKDLYYAIAIQDSTVPTNIGVENYQSLLNRLHKEFPEKQIQFIGNGAQMYQQEIIDLFKKKAQFPEPFPQFCSIEQIAKTGLAQWYAKQAITTQIFPDYLKNYSAIIRYPDYK